MEPFSFDPTKREAIVTSNSLKQCTVYLQLNITLELVQFITETSSITVECTGIRTRI